MTLLILITVSCKTLPKDEKATLPPKPQRKEIHAPDTVEGYALIINYYEHLVQEWELWGETATEMVENPR